MSRNTISTGLAHQRKVAIWVRRRLADAGGGWFDTGPTMVEQYGTVLADGVGLGKTWEALAASALILVERSKERSGGGRRQNIRKQAARVLVLCPPGLVSKWSREVRDPGGFSAHLRRWAGQRARRAFIIDTLTEPYEIRRRADLDDIPSGTIRRDRVELPAGTYICNWNVLRKKVGSGRSRFAALRSQPWDVLIVDEAHHREAREAMETIAKWSRRVRAALLLTATPFQLEPRELHQIFGAILDGSHGAHRVLSRPPVREFVAVLAEFFRGGKAPDRALKRGAEHTLSQALVRSNVRTAGRQYHLIAEDGTASRIAAPDRMREQELKDLLPFLIGPTEEFETWYLRRRLALADGERTFVPTKLRQALSTPAQARLAGARNIGPPQSPRLAALAMWTRAQAEVDLLRAANDGLPRKMLVFTSFVGKAAREIQESLSAAINDAWRAVHKRRAWREMAGAAPSGIIRVRRAVERVIENDEYLAASTDAGAIVKALQSMAETSDDGIARDLFGHRKFRALAMIDLRHRLAALAAVLHADRDGGWWARLQREERRGVQATIAAIGNSEVVRTYTGHDDRRDRDAAGEAFRSPLAPWALVASNVGSEGIDLHSYSAHLVHFDIEWNPARMEQREGRSDRLGRILKEPINVYFTLVRGTYDERMLHQLVARQRWHSILLGRPGARLTRDQEGQVNARILDEVEAQRLALDLRP
jgi:hypothetical protein